MNNARITYRFDHREGRSKPNQVEKKEEIISLKAEDFEVKEDRSERSPESVQDVYWLNEYARDYGAWQSPFDAETERLEKLIREAGEERRHPPRMPAHAPLPVYESEQEERRYHPYWDDEDERRYNQSVQWNEAGNTPGSYRKKTSFPWLKMASSVTGAIVTGAIFGFIALSLFNGEPTDSDQTSLFTTVQSQNGGTATLNQGAAGTAADKVQQIDSTIPSGLAQVNIPSQTYYLLQNGVFSSEQGAQTASSMLRDKGFAATAEAGTDKVAVYAGATLNRNDALWLSQRLKENDFEVYIKTLTLPELHQLKWNSGNSQALEQFISGGSELVQSIGGLTIEKLEEQQHSRIDESTMQTLRKLHQTWLGLENKVSQDAPAGADSAVSRMVNAMNTAMISMEEYNKNPSEPALWQAQTELMEVMLAEDSFRRTL